MEKDDDRYTDDVLFVGVQINALAATFPAFRKSICTVLCYEASVSNEAVINLCWAIPTLEDVVSNGSRSLDDTVIIALIRNYPNNERISISGDYRCPGSVKVCQLLDKLQNEDCGQKVCHLELFDQIITCHAKKLS